jgi:hypothetical protein
MPRVKLHKRKILGILAATVLLFTASRGLAQTDEERAAARAAAEAGLDAFDQKKYAEAVDLLSRAERLMHAPVHLLFIARAHAQLGQLVKAREAYLKLTREQLAKNAPRAFKDAVQSGERELSEVEGKLPYLSLVVQGDSAQNIRVTKNGQRVPQELLGVPHPVDPGQYKFQAFADGMESAESSVVIKEGSKETVVLTLRAVKGGAKASGSSTTSDAGDAGNAGSGESVTADTGTDEGGGISGLRIGAYVGFGVAVVGATVGTIFIVRSGNTRANAQDLFDTCRVQNGGCTEPQQKLVNEVDADADSERNIAIASYVVGGVGLAAGVTMLVLDLNRSQEARHEPGLRPVIGLGYLGLTSTF